MKQTYLPLLVTVLPTAACVAQPPATSVPDPAQPLKEVLSAQAEAWNEGKIDQYMSHYWRSDQLTFSSEGQTTRGWAKTLARYKERYPTREQMGTLAFSHLEVTFLGEDAALLLGRWHLKRRDGDLRGNFSLVFRNLKGRWVIIHDHTSRAPPKEKADR